MTIGALFGCFKVKKSQSERNRRQIKAEQHRHEPNWQNVTEEIMELIVLKLNLSDRMRLSLVCKSWNSVCMRKDIRPPQLPWLIVPKSPKSNKCLTFADLSDGKFHIFELPKSDQKAWLCASSKGWLVMIKEKGLDHSEIFLLNPITRAKHQLPPLKTIPYFRELVTTDERRFLGTFSLCKQVVLSSSDIDSQSCFVAALFCAGGDRCTLGLCRPKDKAWSLFDLVDHRRAALVDLAFSPSGMLHALVMTSRKNQKKKNASELVAPRPLKFGDDNSNVVQLKLVFYKQEEEGKRESWIEVHRDYVVWRKGTYTIRLLESNITNEVLVLQEMLDLYVKRVAPNPNPNNNNHNGHQANHIGNGEGNGGEDEEEEEAIGDQALINQLQGDYTTTSGFRVYKIDPSNDNLVRVDRLKDQVLFLAENGSCSIPVDKGSEGCIYFATNNTKTSAFSCLATYTSRDIGVCYLESGRIERSFPSIYKSIFSRMSWFTPSF